MSKIEIYATYSTYSTYEEAKRLNPECDIFTNGVGLFRAIIEPVTSHFTNGWKLVKPIPQTKEVEWVNGDDVDAYGKIYKYVGIDPFNENLCICLANPDDDPQCFSVDELSKPETQEDREKREELEAAYDLYLAFYQDYNPCHKTIKSFECSRDKDLWLRVVDKTGYRKGGE
ncbi:hypothetical protein VPH159E362A_0046 [Vibrio phage 159E36-2a]